jgi:hypothetical protein
MGRQRKDELEQRMSALQESRRELMVQLEGLMKLLKVRARPSGILSPPLASFISHHGLSCCLPVVLEQHEAKDWTVRPRKSFQANLHKYSLVKAINKKAITYI